MSAVREHPLVSLLRDQIRLEAEQQVAIDERRRAQDRATEAFNRSNAAAAAVERIERRYIQTNGIISALIERDSLYPEAVERMRAEAAKP